MPSACTGGRRSPAEEQVLERRQSAGQSRGSFDLDTHVGTGFDIESLSGRYEDVCAALT